MTTLANQPPGLGTGIYSYAEAEALTRVPARTIRRWMETQRSPIRAGRESDGLLTLAELVEVLVVRGYREKGVPFNTIVRDAEALAKVYGPLPFASRKLPTDGLQILDREVDRYITPGTRQYVAKYVEELFKDLDFAEDGMAVRWYPIGRGEVSVVVDARRSFGEPIVLPHCVPVRTLVGPVRAGDEISLVAECFEVEEDEVRKAIEFDERFKKAA